jgi:hypothetical protein
MKRTGFNPRTPSELPAGLGFGVRDGVEFALQPRPLSTGVQVHPPKPRKVTGFPASVRLAIRRRAGGGDVNEARCESCNIWLGRYGGQVQHIVARMMGGSRERNAITNGCLLCGSPLTGCHGLCEARDEHMRVKGFWRKSSDPVVPLMLHGEQSGVLVWLTPEGGYRVARPGEEAA